jgi:hypothetical protein
MNADLAHELLNELGSSLENLETQQAALFQFLKHEGIVTDEQLAPYLTQADKASDVRWRAARVRLERLISSEKEKEEQRAEKAQHPAAAVPPPSQNQEKDAPSKSDEGAGEAAPHHEATDADSASQSTGAQSVSDKSSPKNDPETSKDKKTSPEQEKVGA